MKRFCILLIFVASFCGSGKAQDLPPDILADQYLLEATKAMEEGDLKKAEEAFQKIEALDIEPPLAFHFFYGKLLVEHSSALKDLLKGQSLLKKYVVRITKDSEHYTPTLKLLSAVAPKLEEALEKATKRFTLPGGASLEMVWIPAGAFTMGSPWSEDGRGTDEGPVHEVTISKGFYLGKYEVTQGQWEAVMGTTPWRGEDYVRSGSDYPAVYVSWEDTQAFIGRLNSAAGSEVYRLPTEAEWEYACRAGTTTRWSFGDDESQLTYYAWYDKNKNSELDTAHRVGTKRANPWGLYDMHGNVWEWVRDWYYDNYYRSSLVDPLGPSIGSDRVVRGVAYDYLQSEARLVRSAARDGRSPVFSFYHIGFRLLRRAD